MCCLHDSIFYPSTFVFVLTICFVLFCFFFWGGGGVWEVKSAQVNYSTLLSVCALTFTRCLSTSASLRFDLEANLFTSLAFKWIESVATDSTLFESSVTFYVLVFASSSFICFF